MNKSTNKSTILLEAINNAAGICGVSKTELTNIIGLSGRENIVRLTKEQNDRAILFIRLHELLYCQFSGNTEQIQLWLRGHNKGTDGVPAEQIKNREGLVTVIEYLNHYVNKV